MRPVFWVIIASLIGAAIAYGLVFQLTEEQIHGLLLPVFVTLVSIGIIFEGIEAFILTRIKAKLGGKVAEGIDILLFSAILIAAGHALPPLSMFRINPMIVPGSLLTHELIEIISIIGVIVGFYRIYKAFA